MASLSDNYFEMLTIPFNVFLT